jgi:hypothetical protein
MTPGQKHAALAGAAWVPVIAYQWHELASGADGWPFSRFIRLLPVWLFLIIVGGFLGWFVPHICSPRKRVRR